MKKLTGKGVVFEFPTLYGKVGRSSIPIRTIAELLMLKQIHIMGDDADGESYLENLY